VAASVGCGARGLIVSSPMNLFLNKKEINNNESESKSNYASQGGTRHGTRKYDRGLSHLLQTELRWLDVPERVLYKLALMVHRCVQDKAPQYLSNYCVPVSEVACRQQLRSAFRHQLLLIPRYRLRTFGRRAFAVAGPTFWNSLADELRTCSSDKFKPALKTFVFASY